MLNPHRTSIVGLICAFGLAALLAGCADSDACDDRTDCDLGEECEGGICQPVDDNDQNDDNDDDNGDDDDDNGDDNNDDEECHSDDDCPDIDESCDLTTNECVEDDDNGDDQGNPEVLSVEPEDGTTGVDVDTQIRVVVDRALDQASISDESLQLRTPSSTLLDGDVDYSEDDDEYELVFTPDQQLREGTRYTIHATSDLQADGSLLPLADEVTTWFITQWEADQEASELAEQFAPVIFQDTKSTDQPDVHLDVPTRVDFDGNYDADDNLAGAEQSSAEVPANVYYSVKSTESHHFIQYILYYPGRSYDEPFDAATYEHDFLGLAMIVDRDSSDVHFVDGVDAGESSTDDSRLIYRPDGSPVQTDASDPNLEPQDIGPEGLEDDSHFQMYVPSGTHAPCYWYNRDDQGGWSVNPCTGTSEEFASEDGVVMRAGDEAQTYDQADDEETDHLEMTYQLRSFDDPFWLRRGDYSCGLFSSLGFTYDPDADRPDGPGDEPAYMPRSLCSDQTTSYGTLPYRWLRSSATDASGGVWFFDPAYYLDTLYDFGDDFSDEYCYNPHFDIDRRDDVDCLPDDCLVDDDCGDDEVCVDEDDEPNVCVVDDECTEATEDDDCADGEVCDTDADPNVCVDEADVDECTEATEDDDCADGEVCDTDADPNVCVDDGDNDGDNGDDDNGDDD